METCLSWPQSITALNHAGKQKYHEISEPQNTGHKTDAPHVLMDDFFKGA